MSYKDTDLNEYGMPNKWIGTAVVESGYNFDSQTERDSVNAMHLKSLTADKITSGTLVSAVAYAGTLTANQISGGTLTLGGTLNGNGLIQVQDATGTSTLQIDNTGVSLASGTTVVDYLGLVSVSAFSGASVVGSGTQTTTSTSYTDVTGLTIDFVTTRTQNVLLFAVATGVILSEDAVSGGGARALIDGTASGVELSVPGRYFSDDLAHINSTSTDQIITSIGAGTHTFKMQFKTTNSSYSMYLNRGACTVGYVILGK